MGRFPRRCVFRLHVYSLQFCYIISRYPARRCRQISLAKKIFKQGNKAITRYPVNIIALLFAALFLFGCPLYKPSGVEAEAARERPQQSAAVPAQDAPPEREAVPETVQVSLPPGKIVQAPSYAVFPETARPGEALLVAYSETFRAQGSGVRGLQAALYNSAGTRLSRAAFFSLPRDDGEAELRAAILAIPSTAASGSAVIRIESADGIIRNFPFTIESRDFIRETIQLNEANTAIRTEPDPQKTAESQQLWAVLSRTGADIYSTGPFAPPVSSTRRTSNYGDRRIYSYIDDTSDTSIHAGIDYGVPAGTEVRACARGRVVMAKYRIVTGNTVILEHLPGLYSLYYHMDRIDITEGDIVEAQYPLGYSGSTGLSTGPHLHWEIRVSTEYADPDAFLFNTVIDKKDIINKMRE